MKIPERIHRLSRRQRLLIGYATTVPVGAALAFLSKGLGWRDDTTLFAGLVFLVVLVPLILPFMMGPLTRLPDDHPDYVPRGSLWPFLSFLGAPVVGLVAYLVARPHTAHWAGAGVAAIYAGAMYLAFAAFVFIRPLTPAARKRVS
jgi:hypothetical protein